MNSILRLPKYLVAVILSAALLSIGCKDSKEDFAPDITPEYAESGIIRLGDYKNAGNFDDYFRLLDSIRHTYFNRSKTDKYFVLQMHSDSYNRIGKHDIAEQYLDSVLELLHTGPRSDFALNHYLWAYFFKADLAQGRKSMDSAYRYYYKALSLAEEYNDKCAIGYYYLKIGLILYYAKQYDDAVTYFKVAYDNCATCTSSFGYFYRTQELCNDIGLCYERMGMYDSAIHYYNTGLQMLVENSEQYSKVWRHLTVVAQAIIKANIGGTYSAAGRYDTAEYYLLESLNNETYINYDPRDAQYTKLKLADVYIKTGKHSQASDILEQVHQYLQKKPNLSVQSRWNKTKWQYWHSLGDKPKAYDYLLAYRNIEDSLGTTLVDFSLATIDNQVKNIGNEYRIAALEKTASQRKMYLGWAIVVGLLSIIVIVLIIKNLKKSREHVNILQEKNKQIAVQQQLLQDTLSELKNTAAEKDRIMKAVSHDMRSPVNSALALLEIFESTVQEPTNEQKEYIHLMRKSGEQALNLTRDLLEVVTLSKEKLEKEPTDITNELRERVALLQFKAAEKEQRVVFEAPVNHISAHVNKEKLLRVVGNLVNNASKFSPVAGEIRVRLKDGTDHFIIEVEDSGIGIPDNLKGKVFDLFSEAKRYGTSGEQPFGLGLSISKQIVEAHGGKIWFESAEAKGTTFYVSIPL
jgi:signal transduction histidine kinase